MKYQSITIIISLFLLFSCKNEDTLPYGNPHAQGFNLEQSDQKAIRIADEVMEAMGGREAWDTTRFFKWTFFGRRDHIWDKKRSLAHVTVPSENLQILIDLNSKSGKVYADGVEMTQPDSVSKYVENGYRMWVNDSYWLVMPFKLKDSGVTLKHIGKDTTQTGSSSDILQMTFADVGVTPDNKYLIYVDDESRLITQWDFYTNFDDDEPRFKSPWPDYKKYGDLLISGGQIGGNKLTNIEVSQVLMDNPFSKLD